MKLQPRFLFSLTLLAPLFLMAIPARAQNASSGSVLGTVTDRSGAAVAKAEVSLTNGATNATARALTNENGQYVFPEVAPGTYRIVVKATGFKTAEIANLAVDVNKSYTVNVQAEVGQLSETVEVVASAQVELQTTDSQVGDVVASRELQRLPTLQRDALNLQSLQPATTPGAGSGLNQDPGNTAGARNDQNTVTLDGFDITDNTTGGQLGTKEVAASTSVEGVEEFRVDVANPTASFGRSPGGVVALVSRSGSNTFHGDAYWYHQENGFNANPWEEGHTALLNNQGDVISQSTPLLPLHDNREGGAIGGPIQKDKTFFFGRYEKHIFQSNSPVTITIPTPSLRAGILTFPDGNGTVTQYNLKTAAVCGQDPKTSAPLNLPCDPRGLGISPTLQAIWNFLPQVGNNTTVGDGLNTTGFTAPVSLPVHDDDASLRVDHNFTKKLHLMARYAYLKDLQNRDGVISVIGGNFQSAQTLTTIGVFAGGVLDYTISPTMLNTARFGYIQSHNNVSAETPAGAAATLNVPGSATSQSGLQTLLSTGITQTPIDNNINQARTQIFGNPAKQFGDDFFWTKGKHNLAFGASDFLLPFGIKHNDRLVAVTSPTSSLGVGNGLTVSTDDRPPTCGGAISANCIPAALVTNYNNDYAATLGLLNSTALVAARDASLNPLPAGSFLIGNYNSSAPQFYAQDTWRVTPSFTLTYGLNYGWQSAPSESNGLVSVLVDPTTGVPINTASYIAARQAAAAAGQIYNPTQGWVPQRLTKSGKIYNTDYSDVGPRVSAAWNPSLTNGLLGALFGGHKTVLRGGFGIIYDRTNLVSNFLATDLSVGFSQALSASLPLCNGSGTPGPGCNAASTNAALSSFRVGQDGAIALPVAQKLTSPIILPSWPNPGFELLAVTNDPNHKEGKNYTVDFTVQRDLGHNMLMEVGYIGRFARNLPTDTDLETFDISFKDPKSGQTFAQAFDATANAVRTGTGSVDQPWFNDILFPGAASALVGLGLGSSFANTEPSVVIFIIDELIGLKAIPGTQFSNRQAEELNSLRNDFGVSNYNAGFVTLHKRMSRGLQFDLNYTFSNSLGNSPGVNQNGVAGIDPFNHGLEYGPSAFNRKHIFNGTYDYELPIGAGHMLGSSHASVNKIIGGWYTAGIVSIVSGLPNFVYSGGGDYGSLNSDSLGLPETAGVSTGVNRGVTGSNGVGTLGNPATCSTDPNGVKFDCGTGINYFANPATASTSFGPILLSSLAQGHTGLGKVLNGFGYWNVDMRLGKETAITERIKMDMSIDALNVFNNVNFETPGLETNTAPPFLSGEDITNPANFGVVSASRILSGHNSSARYLQLGLRITF